MKIIINDANGFVGKNLKEELENLDFEVLSALPRTKSDHAGPVAMVYVSPPSNTHEKQDNAYDAALRAIAAGIPSFIFVVSSHALRSNQNNEYSNDLRQQISQLHTLSQLNTSILYRGVPCHKGHIVGKASILNHMPKPIGNVLKNIVKMLSPTTEIGSIAKVLSKQIIHPVHNLNQIVTECQDQNPAYSTFKFLVDVAISIAIAICLSWLMVIIWIMIKLTSEGPGLFVQERVGRNKKPFQCIKFRTMSVGTKNAGSHEIDKNRVTALGKYLRATKLDELPQIWNIFRREMSLIGPRPCLPTQHDVIEQRSQRDVFSALPGITGLSQVLKMDMSTPTALAQTDQKYIKLKSAPLDITIILKTLLGKGGGDRVR